MKKISFGIEMILVYADNNGMAEKMLIKNRSYKIISKYFLKYDFKSNERLI